MNENWIEKIDAYLEGEMSAQERALFETELSTNQELSSAFRMYQTIESGMRAHNSALSTGEVALKDTLQKLNADYFKPEGKGSARVVQLPLRKLFKNIASIAAAFILIAVCYVLFLRQGPESRRIAQNYIETNLSEISQSMNGVNDLMEQGISAYNQGQFKNALPLFEEAYRSNPSNSDAIKYMGFSYLKMEDYDNVYKEFDELSNRKSLFSNPGNFLKAVTLLKRDNDGDKAQAKILLQQVVHDKSEGSSEAEEWLKKL
jgi:tetratricopeptide (TPR) repeat protein